MNYIYSVTWKRISPNHVEFNCTLACRTSIQACEVHLNNKTSNVSTNLVKLEFSTWATVNFYCLDPQQNYVYEVFARTINVNGLTVHGVLPPLGKYIKTSNYCLLYCNNYMGLCQLGLHAFYIVCIKSGKFQMLAVSALVERLYMLYLYYYYLDQNNWPCTDLFGL